MLEDNRINIPEFLEALLWFRAAPHQVNGAIELYTAISQSDPCLLDRNASWYRAFHKRDKLVKSFVNPEGE